MSSIIGFGINQIPTNGMLGGLAFQDPNYASISLIQASNAGTQNGNLILNPVSGNIGIGTTTTTAKLEVSGGVRISGVTTVTNTTNASATNTGALQVAGGVGIGQDLRVGGTIFGNISGAVTGSASQVNTIERTTNATHFLTFVDTNNSSSSAESLYTSSTFVINPSNGNMGIGTASPSHRLQIVPVASSNTVSALHVSSNWGSVDNALVIFDGNISGSGDGNVLLVKGGGTRSDVETFEVRNGSTTTFIVKGNSNVGIGVFNPATKLDIKQAGANWYDGAQIIRSTNDNQRLVFGNTNGASIIASVDAAGGNNNDLLLGNSTNGTTFSERVRITSAGVVLIGNSATRSTGVLGSGQLQLESTSYAALQLFGNINTVDGAYIGLWKSRSGTLSGTATVNSGDTTGGIWFGGADGTTLRPNAYILGQIDGTPSTSSMPGRIIFGTTANGSNSVTERVRIHATGNVSIGTTFDGGTLYVFGGVPGSGINLRTRGDVVIDSGGSLFFDGNYSYATGNYIRPVSANTQAYFTAGTERLRITSTGNIGIGTTAPSTLLDVAGGVRISGIATLTNITNSVSTNTGALTVSGGVGIGGNLNVLGNGTFGTTSSAAVLTVINTTTSALNIRSNAAFISPNNSNTITLSMLDTDVLTFTGGLGELFSISDSFTGTLFAVNDILGVPSIEVFDTGLVSLAEFSGNVGIGTTSTTAKLTVNGGVRISGLTTVTNTTNASSTTTGALQVIGGAGIGRDLYVGGTIFGNISGTVTGSASQVNTVQRTTNAAHYLTFVDSDNASSTAELLYTTSSLTINPSTSNVGISTTNPTERLQVNGGNIFINGENVGLIVDSGQKRIGFMKYSGHEAYISRVTGQDFGIVRVAGSDITVGTTITTDLYVGSTGDIGIGTNNPARKLDVNGAIRVASGAPVEWGGVTAYITGESSTNTLFFGTSGSERMRLDSAGNLGLGVTPSSWSTLRVLQLPAGSIASYDGGGSNRQINFINNAYYDGSTYRYVVTDTAQRYTLINGQHQWFNASSGTSGNAITFTQAMTLDASGNLLVGTTTANNTFPGIQVGTTSSGKSLLITSSSAGNNGLIQFIDQNGANALQISGNSVDTFFYGYGSRPMKFFTNGTERVRITASGDFGIGTTSPVHRVSIQRDSTAGVGIALNLNNPYAYGAGAGTAAVGLRFNRTPNDAGSTGVMADIYAGNELELTSQNGYLAFATRSGTPEVTVERMRVTSLGNIGIGTTAPSTRLEVSGGVLITGITTVTNTTNATSTTTGALQVAGGAGIGGNLYVGGEIVAQKLTIQLTTITTTLVETDDIIRTLNTTQTTSTTTGALQVSGGAGIGRDLYVGGTIYGNISGTVTGSASQVNTIQRTTNAAHFLTFVDSNNASSTGELVYTTSSLSINPSTGNVGVGNLTTSSRLEVLGNGDPTINTIGLKVGLANHLPNTGTKQYGIYVEQRGGRYAPQTGIYVDTRIGQELYSNTYYGIEAYTESSAQAYQTAYGILGQATNTGANYGCQAYGIKGVGISASGGGSVIANGQGSWGGHFTAYGLGNAVGVYADAYLQASPIAGAVAIPLLVASNGTERMRVTDTGNLGLGVIPSAWGNNFRAFQINSGGGSVSGNSRGINVVNNAYNDNTNWIYFATAPAARYNVDSGQHQWLIAPSGTAGNTISFTTAMQLDANGDWVVGSTSPDPFGRNDQRRAAIVGSGSTDNAALSISAGASSGRGAQIYLGQSSTRHFTISANVTESTFGTISSSPLRFTTNDTERMRLTSTGNLGIGTTAPGGKLHVTVAATTSGVTVNEIGDYAGSVIIGADSSTNNGDRIPLVFNVGSINNPHISSVIEAGREASGWNTYLAFYTNNVTSGPEGTDAIQEKMRLNSAGNVGIGITPSATVVDFKSIELGSAGNGLFGGTGGFDCTILSANSFVSGASLASTYATNGFASQLRLQNDGSFTWNLAPSGTAGNVISFNQAMTLDANGRLGIGITSPSTTLHVVGTATFVNTTTSAVNIRSNAAFVSPNNLNTLTVRMLDSDVLTFNGAAGQLFSISDSFTGTIFAVNDISGVPSIEVYDTGLVSIAEFTGNVGIGTTSTTAKLTVNGGVRISGITTVTNTTNATSTTTGALQVVGGVGIGQDLRVGGTIYGNISGTVSGSSSQVNTIQRTTNAAHYLTFVDSDNASSTGELLYTTSSFTINPSTGNVGIGASSPGQILFISRNQDTATQVRLVNANSGSNAYANFVAANDTSNVIEMGIQSSTRSTTYPVNEGWIYTSVGLNLGYIGATKFYAGSAERMRLDSSGNLGIGTSNPGTKLQVVGEVTFGGGTSADIITIRGRTSDNYGLLRFASSDGADFRGYIGSPADNVLAFFDGGFNERMRLDAAGNLGLGVTPSAWGSTYRALDVRTAAVYDTPAGTASGLTFNAIYNGTNWVYKGTGGNASALRYEQGAAQHQWFIAPSGASGNTISFTQAMTLTATGSLGIGTTAPSALLEISRATTDAVVLAEVLRVSTTGRSAAGGTNNRAALITTFDSSNSTLTSAIGGIRENPSGHWGTAIALYTNNGTGAPANSVTDLVERMRINSSGNIGIGTTSPQARLDIFQSAAINTTTPGSTRYGIHLTPQNATADTAVGLTFGAGDYGSGQVPEAGIYSQFSSNYGTKLYFATTNNYGTGAITRLMIDHAGNVGIGTTNPSSKFHVSASSGYLEIRATSGSNNAFLSVDSNLSYVGTYQSIPLTFQTANTERMRIFSNGNVAIGTTTDGGFRLEVNGSFAATTKSFVIDHPTKPGKKLRYGSLEGPENGVYVRGRLQGTNIIKLPDYWIKLVDPNSITVNLTPIGRHQNLYVEDITDNTVIVGNSNLLNKNINCFYTVFAERADVSKLQVEI